MHRMIPGKLIPPENISDTQEDQNHINLEPDALVQ